jgi:hypothetical protein
MALKLVTKQKTTMETNSAANTRKSMLEQVARSKGNEWMISSYQAWQKRCLSGSKARRDTSATLRLVSRMAQG